MNRNHIKEIHDAAGNKYDDETQISEVFVNYFETLFKAGEQVDPSVVTPLVPNRITPEMTEHLTGSFKGDEVKEAIDQMHPTKSPGPDGMCALFYQKYWHVVGRAVVDKVLEILNFGGDIARFNQTHIVLIPKKKKCETPADFRPISLCNVIYKIVVKVLANRLKKVLPAIVHESQSGFVPGRLNSANILVAYECFHYLRKKKKGKMGFLGLKLDMSKAYDRVECQFLEKMMIQMGFPVCFTKKIMRCVSTATFDVLVNGQPSPEFTPSRGLRQGDPLSPFLFILCAEGLSVLLRDAEQKKSIHGVKVGRKVEPITHLFFADDSLLFVRATEEEVENVKEILATYEVASGQKLNMDKSEVSFSRNIDRERKEILQMKLTFKAVDEHDKYLGLPTYVGSSKKRIFHTIQDRIWKKFKGWKENFLSQAGREILIKFVVQAIPTFAMQCFSFPVQLLKEIEQMFRSFFWGQRGNERKTAWVSWEKLY